MGTAGSVGFIYKDKESLSYNHFDSYPDGLGRDVLELISKVNKEYGWKEFKQNASQLNNIEVKEITDLELIEKYKKYSDLDVSSKKFSDPYCLFRKIQGSQWIYEVYEGNLQDYKLDNKFIHNSLFCEYAYIINIDSMKLEFYSGFQKIPQIGNRFGIDKNTDGYYPCRLVCVFSLYDIFDSVDVYNIIEKMEEISESEKDDPSIITYQRKFKLDLINNSTLIL